MEHQSKDEPDPMTVQRLQAKLESALQAPHDGEMPNKRAAENAMDERQDSFDIEALRLV